MKTKTLILFFIFCLLLTACQRGAYDYARTPEEEGSKIPYKYELNRNVPPGEFKK